MSKPCKPSQKYPLDLYECNPVTGRYIKKKSKTAEKEKAKEAAAKKKEQVKAKIVKLREEAVNARLAAVEKCAAAKLKAAEKVAVIKDKIAALKPSGGPKKVKMMKWTPPFAAAQFQ